MPRSTDHLPPPCHPPPPPPPKARDTVKRGAVAGAGAEERAIVGELHGARAAEWLAKAGKVYLLAELVMDRNMERLCGAPPPRGIARPWARL